jgi:hypothetical protein
VVITGASTLEQASYGFYGVTAVTEGLGLLLFGERMPRKLSHYVIWTGILRWKFRLDLWSFLLFIGFCDMCEACFVFGGWWYAGPDWTDIPKSWSQALAGLVMVNTRDAWRMEMWHPWNYLIILSLAFDPVTGWIIEVVTARKQCKKCEHKYKKGLRDLNAMFDEPVHEQLADWALWVAILCALQTLEVFNARRRRRNTATSAVKLPEEFNAKSPHGSRKKLAHSQR